MKRRIITIDEEKCADVVPVPMRATKVQSEW